MVNGSLPGTTTTATGATNHCRNGSPCRFARSRRGRRVLLHCQAVDDDAPVWVDGREVGRHRGGFTPFACDLGAVAGQEITIVVWARDDHRRRKPQGKQSTEVNNQGCHDTRPTGIWQTVWLEPVAALHFERPRITTDFFAGPITVETPLSLDQAGYSVGGDLSLPIAHSSQNSGRLLWERYQWPHITAASRCARLPTATPRFVRAGRG